MAECEPNNRGWPGQICNRCIHLGRECSENVRAIADNFTPSLGESKLTKHSEKSEQSLVDRYLDSSKDWGTLRVLSVI